MSSWRFEDLFSVTRFLRFHDTMCRCGSIFIHCPWYCDLSVWKLMSISSRKTSWVISPTFLPSIILSHLFLEFLFGRWTSTSGPLISRFTFLLFSSLYPIVIPLGQFPSKILLSFLFMPHTFILFELLLVYFICFCVTLFWCHGYKVFYPVKNIYNVIRSFSFFPIYFLVPSKIFLCVWFDQYSHIRSFLNWKVLKLRNTSQ